MKLYKLIILILFTSLSLFGADNDFDGVEDNIDRCLNTPILDMVDKHGCSKNQKAKKYTINIDQYLSQTNTINDTLYTYSLDFLLYKDTISYTINTGKVKSNNSIKTTDISAKVQKTFFTTNKHSFNIGFGFIFPTYSISGNKTDYNYFIDYTFYNNNFNTIFSYNLIDIKDDQSVKLNIFALSLEYNYKNLLFDIGYTKEKYSNLTFYDDNSYINYDIKYFYDNYSYFLSIVNSNNKDIFNKSYTIGIGVKF